MDQEGSAEEAHMPLPGVPDPALLELSDAHPMNRLYHLGMETEEGKEMPLVPPLRLDDQGLLSPDAVGREVERLQKGLTAACISRLGKAVPKEKDASPPDLDALPWIFFSYDKLAAWMLIFPPVGQGEEINQELLRQALKEQSVSYGVDQTLVDCLPKDKNRYFHLFPLARGKPVVDGENGDIVDSFPRTAKRVVTADENGRVDYASLSLIHNVEKGDEICRLIPPTEGVPGRTVQDQEIPAKEGKAVPLPKGRNTEISEDGARLLASRSGCVEFTGRTFQVKPTLDVPGNVDFSVGNINFLGDVQIHGDVCSGFTVRAMGNIHVDGVVESGGIVEAGGDLVVVKGIMGDEETIVRAQKGVFSKYMENATIYAREGLQADCVLNCNIYSDGEILIRSGRGVIMGGQTWSAQKVSARVVGSRSECQTSIFLGGLPCTNFEREVLLEGLEKLKEELKKAEDQPDSPAKPGQMAKTRVRLSADQLKLEQLEKELADAKEEIEENDRRRLECDIAYPGTEITIGDQILRLKEERRQCTVRLSKGEVTFI